MSDALNTKNNIVTLKDAELSFRLGKNKNIKVLDKLNLEIENGKVLGLSLIHI